MTEEEVLEWVRNSIDYDELERVREAIEDRQAQMEQDG